LRRNLRLCRRIERTEPVADREIFERNINNWESREPVMLGTAVVQLIVTGIALAATFGLSMSDAQVNALWGFLAAFSTVLWIAAAAIRAHVVSPATYQKDVAVALATEPPVK
jgi:uncharacterized membrane protein